MDSAQSDLERWYKHGLELIGKNEVAVVLMAGEMQRQPADKGPPVMY